MQNFNINEYKFNIESDTHVTYEAKLERLQKDTSFLEHLFSRKVLELISNSPC